MENNVVDWIICNLLALTGNIYVNRDTRRKIVVDPCILIVILMIWIFISVMIGSVTSVANIPSLKEYTSTEKYWYGFGYGIIGFAITYVISLIFRWFDNDFTSGYRIDGIYCNNYRCVPFLPLKDYKDIQDENKREERELRKAKYFDEEKELERDLNNLITNK